MNSEFEHVSAVLSCYTCEKKWEGPVSALRYPSGSLLSVWRSEERVCPFCNTEKDIPFGEIKYSDLVAVFPKGTLHILGEVCL